MWVTKRLIGTGLQCYSKYFGLIKTTLKSVITKALLYKVGVKLIFKSVWVAMCSLVMSLSSRDFLIKYYLPWLIYSIVEHIQRLVFR